MSLLTIGMKKDKELMKFYEQFIEDGLKPQKALKKSKESLKKKHEKKS